jgi:hypothetical protein
MSAGEYTLCSVFHRTNQHSEMSGLGAFLEDKVLQRGTLAWFGHEQVTAGRPGSQRGAEGANVERDVP